MPKRKAARMPKGTQNRKRSHGENITTEELKILEQIVLGDGNYIFKGEDTIGDVVDKETPEVETKTPAWLDESDILEDEQLQGSVPNSGGVSLKNINQAVRENKFKQLTKRPKWADYSKSEKEQDSILKKCGNLITKSGDLEQDRIEIKKLKDLNSQTYNEGPITAVKFHPKSTVAMVTGLSGVVSLFQVDGKENTKLQSIKFHRFPIYCAAFVKDGEEFLVGSKYHKYFNSFNLMTGQTYKVNNKKMDGIMEMKKFVVSPDDKYIAVCGQFGKIYILSGNSKECIDSFQMNCNVGSVVFSSDGSKMYSHGEDGEVYIWDMKSRRCIQKFTDDGCVSGTAIDVSSNNSFIACGSNAGVVNVYDAKSVMLNNCKPIKTFYNLVTPITNVKFNPTSEILSIASYHKENALRLIHLSSMTVFSNFPVPQSKLNCINCVDFSPNSGYYSVGDTRKTAHLFRLKYFGNY